MIDTPSVIIKDASYGLVALLAARAESAEAERDRYRDALIACRKYVKPDLADWRRIKLKTGTLVAAAEVTRLQALLDTIDAAAKGQG